MKTTYLAALAALLTLSTAAPCSAKPATNGAASRTKAASAAGRLDILKWPAYPGAELVEQVSLSESQLKALGNQIDADARQHIRRIKYVAVVGYRLPATAALKDVIAFYEPRVLDAGYKIFVKDLSDPEDASAMYAGPKENFLVLSADSEGEGVRTLEIVSVEGPLASLASMGEVMKKTATPSLKPAPTPR